MSMVTKQRSNGSAPRVEEPQYLVALVSRERARLALIEGRTITELAELASEVPQRAKRVPRDRQFGRDDKTARHLADHLRSHLKLVATTIADTARRHRTHGWLLATHAELVPSLTAVVPSSLKRRLVTWFKADDDVSPAWLRDKALAAITAARNGEPLIFPGVAPARRASRRGRSR